jgi:hypothetical protein
VSPYLSLSALGLGGGWPRPLLDSTGIGHSLHDAEEITVVRHGTTYPVTSIWAFRANQNGLNPSHTGSGREGTIVDGWYVQDFLPSVALPYSACFSILLQATTHAIWSSINQKGQLLTRHTEREAGLESGLASTNRTMRTLLRDYDSSIKLSTLQCLPCRPQRPLSAMRPRARPFSRERLPWGQCAGIQGVVL